MTRIKNTYLAALAILLSPMAATADLIDRGSGMIYDDVLDITWLQNANQGGLIPWDDSVAWADSLIFGGFDDWRLASMDVNMDGTFVDCNGATELSCRDNQLGYMYYHNLGGSRHDDLTGNQGLFTNIQGAHWAGEEFAPGHIDAWTFYFASGGQEENDKTLDGFVGSWAVREGDSAPVPEPGTLALLSLGLAGIGFSRRKKA